MPTDITGQIQQYQTQLRELASELAMAEERERRAIAVDLHDHIGQTLALARMKLGELRGDMIFQGYDRQITAIQRLVEEAIRYTRTLTSELSSPVLYELGFLAGISSLASQLQEKHGLEIHVQDDGFSSTLEHGTAVLLYKSVRELLINVIKHAKATSATVTLGRGFIAVSDNGQGFAAKAPDENGERPKVFGLFSIRERLAHVGGAMEIDSAPGRGTTVCLRLETGVCR